MKLADTLRECAGLERRIAGFYQQFAELWREDEELAHVWQWMADEELGHAYALETAALRIDPTRRRERIDREALAQLRGYVVGTGRIIGAISLDDAFRTALELETLELHRIYLQILNRLGDDPALEKTLRDCLAKLGPHEAPLLETIERRTSVPELRARVERLQREVHG
jgi:rubrerythrin